MASDDNIGVLDAGDLYENPFSLARSSSCKPPSPQSSHGPPHKTRHRAFRKPPIPPKTPQLTQKHTSQEQETQEQDTYKSQQLATIPSNQQNETPIDFGQELELESLDQESSQRSTPCSSLHVSLQGSKQRPKTSQIWSQFTLMTDRGVEYYKYNHCSEQWKRSGGTHAPTKHLKTIHHWDPIVHLLPSSGSERVRISYQHWLDIARIHKLLDRSDGRLCLVILLIRSYWSTFISNGLLRTTSHSPWWNHMNSEYSWIILTQRPISSFQAAIILSNLGL